MNLKHCFLYFTFFVIAVKGLYAQAGISYSQLQMHVTALSHDSMQGRLTGTAACEKAADYLANYMQSIGLEPFNREGQGGFMVPWVVKGKRRHKEQKGTNIAGYIPGNGGRDSLIVFSAHYDHIGTNSVQKSQPFGPYSRKQKGDSIFNGANDNATGVAAMLEIARVFKQVQPHYSLLFVAFSGEEEGLLGSADFASKLNPGLVLQVINLEMLGRPMGRQPFVTEGNSQDFRYRLNKNLYKAEAAYGKEWFVADPYGEQGLYERSDNYPFAKRGISANTIMGTSPYDEYYHSAADEAKTIEFMEMFKTVTAIYLAVLPMVLHPVH